MRYKFRVTTPTSSSPKSLSGAPPTLDTMKLKRQPKPPGAGAKFKLLMWKNFLQQWRHPAQTVFEVVIPVITMCLVLILRWQIEPQVQDTITHPALGANSLLLSSRVLLGMDFTRMSIAYSPESEVIEDVIRSATAKLILENLRDIIESVKNDINSTWPDVIQNITLPWNNTWPPDAIQNITLPWNITWPETIELPDKAALYEFIKGAINLTAYNNGSELRGIYAHEEAIRRVIAAVEFPDDMYGATELPSNMQYDLRFPERPRLNSFFGQGGRSWRTDNVFPLFELPGPRFPSSWEGGNDPPYVNEMFLAFQQVISMELISKYTGENFSNFQVNINRYPHPPYVWDLAVEILQALFPTFIMISFSYTAVNIVRAVTVEKELQLKETMKIMGLPTWLHWTAWFWKQFIYLILTTVLIIVILKVNWFTTEDGFSDYAVFTHTPWTVLFLYLSLYMMCVIFFCFMISGFFSKANSAALFAGVIWFLTYIPAFLLSIDINMSPAVQAFTCLSINSAMAYGFQLLFAKESTGGMQWGDFLDSPSVDNPRMLFGHVLIMLVVNCVIYMLIALYMEQVLPGPFGTPKPFYFFLQKSFWRSSNKVMDEQIQDSVDSEIDGVMKEKDPEGHTAGVQMKNLTKIYGPNIAVNNLSLNIYDDQITVLLGHNGAGKSTTISMLTGNVEITSGTVKVAGYDMATHTHAARAHMGLCPQHNVLFNELTVREHLEFFARLKGFTGKELKDEIDSLIAKLELEEKRDYQSQGLSGGQKRRLAVGIALCGRARVVLLDEPTSGMDPASRRALWDLLQKEKYGRSMILTTHFMDEADILGDRVAIMANGSLQCVGSPYFLKRHYGVGYTLVVVKDEGFDQDLCTAVLNKYIPGTVVKEDRGTEVTYSLLNEFSHMFEPMLTNLEANAKEIKYLNYGLTATTLEDVFMSVGSDVNHYGDDETITTTESVVDSDVTYDFESLKLNGDKAIYGIRLWWMHTQAMWWKLWLVWSRSWVLIVLQVLVPVLQINATLGVMRYVTSLAETIQRRMFSLTQGYIETETLLSFNGSLETSLGARAKSAYEALFAEANLPSMVLTLVDKPIDDYYLNRSKIEGMGSLRHQLLTGATFNDNSATAWFSNFAYHDLPTSLAAIHSAILRSLSSEANITVFNHPLEASYADQSNIQLMVQMLAGQLAGGIGSSLGIVSAVFIMFYIKERVSRAKLLQKAAGIQPVIMWFSAALFDWLWFLIISLTIIISCAAFQVIGLSTFEELGRMYLLIMVYGAAMLPINYVFSYFFNGPGVGFVTIFFINVLFGTMGAQIVEALASPALTTADVANILDSILQFFPLYSLVKAAGSLNQHGLLVFTCLQGCDYLAAVLPNLECNMTNMCNHFSENCCVEPDPYWNWEEPGVMRYIVAMIASCVVVWAILMIAEYRVPQKIFNRERKPPPVDKSSLDNDVVREAEHVSQIGKGLAEHSLVAQSLSKYYGKHLAVDQVSFTVSDTECFGLLGVNGAGKTTTFKMLMGDETISSGNAYVAGDSVKTDITKVYENIGYCPQFDAVFNEFTGRETIRFFGMLRGLHPDTAAGQTEALAHALGFTKHIDKQVVQYSGGNKRKLSTAVALLGRTRLVFVDEPTTGVDPAAKRQVWAAIRGARRMGRGVVLTSHSMEECEALCTRLTIMVNGRFQCLGTPQHLKNKFSQGFTLTIKMQLSEDSTVAEATTEEMKRFVSANFINPKIMEEYQGLVTYYLPDTRVPWSHMFGIMERAKRELSVEDYSISQTTLEQIFLQFTKYQRQEDQSR